MSQKQKRIYKTERATGLGRRTRKEIEQWGHTDSNGTRQKNKRGDRKVGSHRQPTDFPTGGDIINPPASFLRRERVRKESCPCLV